MVTTRTYRQSWIDKVGFYGPADRWPPEAVALAFAMRADNKSYGQIAIAVGRTPDAVAARLRGRSMKPYQRAVQREEKAPPVERLAIMGDNERFVSALRRAGAHVSERPVEMSSFECQLERVKAGAAIIEIRPIRRPDPTYTLGGVSDL